MMDGQREFKRAAIPSSRMILAGFFFLRNLWGKDVNTRAVCLPASLPAYLPNCPRACLSSLPRLEARDADEWVSSRWFTQLSCRSVAVVSDRWQQ